MRKRAAALHVLTFSQLIAILDPVSGMGVLVLPSPADQDVRSFLPGTDHLSPVPVQQRLRVNVDEYNEPGSMRCSTTNQQSSTFPDTTKSSEQAMPTTQPNAAHRTLIAAPLCIHEDSPPPNSTPDRH